MSVLEIVIGAALIIVSLIVIFLVMAQKSREEGLGASFGDVGGFEGTRGSSSEMVLRKWTKIFAVVFAILVLIANIIVFVLK